ncbi:hypothetical protein ACFY04_42080 [Streptomyces sp. NPDC001549]|uniref:hypothetical protein n=1 Tax=Streptomyces sp. NPDC001549 TaxID=3364586 RepID=UPI0036A5513A
MACSRGAVALAEPLSGLDMTQICDECRAALEQVVAAKVTRERLPAAEAAEPVSAEVVDLMAMLEKSVQDAKATRGELATVHQLPGQKKRTARKTSSTAATAKKTAARKAASQATTRSPRRSAVPPGRCASAKAPVWPGRHLAGSVSPEGDALSQSVPKGEGGKGSRGKGRE